VIIEVEIPTKLTKDQRELFEKLAATMGTTVKPKEKGFLDWLNETLEGNSMVGRLINNSCYIS